MESQRFRQLNDFHFIAVCQRWGYWQDEGVCRVSSTLVILMSFSGPFNLASSGFSAAPPLIVAIQLLSHVQLFFRPPELQASLPFTISRILLKLLSIELMMPSNHLTLCNPLLLLPSIFPSIRVFSNELALGIRWSKYWSFSISSSQWISGLISFRKSPMIISFSNMAFGIEGRSRKLESCL